MSAAPVRFLVGSYNRPGPYFHATGEGLAEYRLDPATGEIRRVARIDGADNTTYLAAVPGGFVAACDFYLDAGRVAAFQSSADGDWMRGLQREAGGGAVCHVAFDPVSHLVFVTAYLDGITVHRFDPASGIAPHHQTVAYPGSGPRVDRQERSHPHQAVACDGFLWVPDLGCDRIWRHAITRDPAGAGIGPAEGIVMEPGSGPRHLACHAHHPRLYLLGELDARLRTHERSPEGLRPLSVLDTLPPGCGTEAAGAAVHLHPGGRALYVSNRNCDTLTAFALDERGDPVRAACFFSGGRTPRDFAFSPCGGWLVCAHQDSHSLAAFRVDPGTGLPDGFSGPPHACGSPACVLFP